LFFFFLCRKQERAIAKEAGPLSLTIPMAPSPEGVDMAAIVSVSIF